MLEVFFDEEKNFSVFEQIIKSDDDIIDVTKIGWDLKVEPPVLFEIIHALEFLDVLEIVDETHVQLNLDSKILLAICIFDEIIGNYALQKCKGIFDGDDGHKENDNLQDFREFLQEFMDL